MEASHWVGENWFDLLQTVGIIGGLFLTAYTVRKDERARQIGNSIAISHQYLDIWKVLYTRPDLARVLSKDLDLKLATITVGEELFVTSLILHLGTVYRAMKHGEFITLEGLQKDVKDFFSLPIPKNVWEKIKPLQDETFVKFIETTLK